MPEKVEEFQFHSYIANWKTGKLNFLYKVLFHDREETFMETLTLPASIDEKGQHKETLERILRDLHLVCGISYYKQYCPEKITINNVSLTKRQADFWNMLYTKGLGEFFYTNSIDYRGLINFPFRSGETDKPKSHQPEYQRHATQKALIPIGGGKDSIVTIELIKKTNIPYDLFSLNFFPVQKAVADVIGRETHVVHRDIDNQMLSLAKTDRVYNGHVPISAIYAFVALLYAILYDYTDIVFSNERSSNYGNVHYLDAEVNHQWSKSEEFENLFRTYIAESTIKGIEYFSLLRPFYEIKIAEMFSSYPQYFQYFSSSNHNFKIDQRGAAQRWDHRSPKTLFVFVLLAAFLNKEQLLEIFGRNLYEDVALLEELRALLGLKQIKPFECVGTPEETKVAMRRAYRSGTYAHAPAMKMFEDEVLSHKHDWDILEKEVFAYGNQSNIPEKFRTLL